MIRPSLNRRLARLLYVYTCLSEEVGEIGGMLTHSAGQWQESNSWWGLRSARSAATCSGL